MNKTNLLIPPLLGWLGLLLLTVISLALGARFGAASWMPLIVAAIIWIKANIVARYFIESHLAHPFITWVLRVFIAFTTIGLVMTSLLNAH